MLRGEWLPVRAYTTADGLAGNTVERIVRDSRGFLWFCTRNGLSRFDGYEFRNFGMGEGLPIRIADLFAAISDAVGSVAESAPERRRA